MELSEYQIKMVEAIAKVAPPILMKHYREDCCIIATRIVVEVLKRLHFKHIKPFVVEGNVFNESYVRKGRTPQSQEEAQEWLKEGAWQIVLGDRVDRGEKGKWAGHLVVLLNDKYMFDVAAYQANRPHKQIRLDPLFTTVPEDFVKGEDKCQLMYNNCLVIYQAFPNDKSYQHFKDWCDLTRSKRVVGEVYEEVKFLLGKKK